MGTVPRNIDDDTAQMLSEICGYLNRRSSASLGDIANEVRILDSEKVAALIQILRRWGLVRYDMHLRRWALVSDAWYEKIQSHIRRGEPEEITKTSAADRALARTRVIEILQHGGEKTLAELSDEVGLKLCDANLQFLVKKHSLIVRVENGVRYYRVPIEIDTTMNTLDRITAGMATLGVGKSALAG